MHDHPVAVLSATDYARLQGLMCTLTGSRTPLADLLRRKLEAPVVMLPSDAGPDLVRSGSKVRFRIDGERVQERRLVWEPPVMGDTSTLSLQLPRGLALLGLSIGQAISYAAYKDRTEHLEVEYVLPEEHGDLPPPEHAGTFLHAALAEVLPDGG